MTAYFPPAPEFQVSQWLNTPEPVTLEALRGQVVVMHAFQMLCPACVTHGLPQARRTQQMFPASEVSVIGIHSVFEHHTVMTEAALRVFAAEYRYTFPIGIDQHLSGSIPATMRAYQWLGTPSVVLLDRRGRIRLNHFGSVDDLALGVVIGRLTAEDRLSQDQGSETGREPDDTKPDTCDQTGCRVQPVPAPDVHR